MDHSASPVVVCRPRPFRVSCGLHGGLTSLAGCSPLEALGCEQPQTSRAGPPLPSGLVHILRSALPRTAWAVARPGHCNPSIWTLL